MKEGIGQERVSNALNGVQHWVEDRDYRGYEPFDGLSSWARPLACGHIFLERLLMQLIRQSPLNLRPLLGVQPQDSTKGRGYMASGYLLLYRTTGNASYLQKALGCLDWLDQHKAPRFQHHAWSNAFDFVSRGGSYTREDPIIVWTALIGYAYVEAFEVTGDERWLRIAESACRWVMELPREKTDQGDCLSYLADRQASVHNANMLGASLLARTARHTGDREFLRSAGSAMHYSCSRQLASGAWLYGEAPRYHWIDNFHTGYNLDSLYHYIQATGDQQYRPNLQRGLTYYKRNFFEVDGCPKYYHNRKYPVDIQAIAQSIETLSLLADLDAGCLPLAEKVAGWTIDNMQDSTGYFYYRRYPLMIAKTPMLHWGQATMFKALAMLHARIATLKTTPTAEFSRVTR